MFHESFKDAQRKISGGFKEVSRMLQERFKGITKKIEVLFCNFVLACISSQLPEQKEGLFHSECVVVLLKCKVPLCDSKL